MGEIRALFVLALSLVWLPGRLLRNVLTPLHHPEEVLALHWTCLLEQCSAACLSSTSLEDAHTTTNLSPRFPTKDLRGPAAILFISRHPCSDSIAKLFRVASLPAWEKIAFGPLPQTGKNGPKINVLTGKFGEKRPQTRKIRLKTAPPKPILGRFILFLGHFFLIFPVRPKLFFGPFFPGFGRKPKSDFLPRWQTRNFRVCFYRVSHIYITRYGATKLRIHSYAAIPLGTKTLPNQFETDLGKVIFVE